MSYVPDNLRYAPSHEWLLLDADGIITVGITDHAQEALGDLVFIELPDVGGHYVAEKEIAVVESVKAAADVPTRRSPASSPKSIRPPPMRRKQSIRMPTRPGCSS